MSRAIFPLKMPAEPKKALCEIPKIDNRTQTDLINEAVKLHLLTPQN